MQKRVIRIVEHKRCALCSTCAMWLPVGLFYKDHRSSIGLKSECKKCHYLTCMASRDPEKVRKQKREWMREYQKRPEVRERERMRSRARNKGIAFRARALANRAVELGFLIRPDRCPECHRTAKIQGHHADHTKPLDVVWLCALCHAAEHRRIGVSP